jgi:hypothetical protein
VKDHLGCFWIATENGVQLINASKSLAAYIEQYTKETLVKQIEVVNQKVYIASNKGISLYNYATKKYSKLYDASMFGNIFKLKNLSGTLWILCSNGAFTIQKDQLIAVKYNQQYGKLFDIVEYMGETIAVTYDPSHLLKFEHGAFSETRYTKDFKTESVAYLTMAVSGDTLVLGGATAYKIIVRHKVVSTNPFPLVSNVFYNFAVWDIAIVQNKIWLALGDTHNLMVGGLLNTNASKLNFNELDKYTQCLYYDKAADNLWVGTLNRGIYILNNISTTIYNGEKKYAQGPVKNSYYLYKDSLIQYFNQNSQNKNIESATYRMPKGCFRALASFGDTSYIFGYSEVFNKTDASGFDLKKKFVFGKLYTQIEKLNNELYCFNLYYPTTIFNIKDYSYRTLGENKIITNVKKCGAAILVHNQGIGFALYTSNGYKKLESPSKGLGNIDDFTFVKNNLVYCLKEDSLFTFKISQNQLTLIDKIGYNGLIEDFKPKWICNDAQYLYLISKNGIIRLNKYNKPEKFYYLGNRELMERPVIDAYDRIVISNGGYTSFINTNEFNRIPKFGSFEVLYQSHTLAGGNLLIQIKNDHFFAENHLLKQVVLMQASDTVYAHYTTGNQFAIPNNLKAGNYSMLLSVESLPLFHSDIVIQLPLLKNPLFYFALALVSLGVLFILLRFWYQERMYKKRLYQNELEMIQQNLNPHFVFNSLNLIYNNILEDDKEVALENLRGFSKLHRNFLERSKEKKVTLQSEIDFIKAYLNMEKLRFIKDIEVEYEIFVDPTVQTEAIFIPPNILQPLIENALKYGILAYKGAEKKGLILQIKAFKKGSIISIENPCNDLSANQDTDYQTNMGLRLVSERIQLYNRELNANIVFESNLPAIEYQYGYRVELLLPHNKH